MEQTDGETAALTSPESIKAQMKVAIANFQASPRQPDLWSGLKQLVKVSTNVWLIATSFHTRTLPVWSQLEEWTSKPRFWWTRPGKFFSSETVTLSVWKVWHERHCWTWILRQKEKVPLFRKGFKNRSNENFLLRGTPPPLADRNQKNARQQRRYLPNNRCFWANKFFIAGKRGYPSLSGKQLAKNLTGKS